MKPRLSLPAFLGTILLSIVPPASTDAVSVDVNGHRFTLPDGFEIQLVAHPPLVDRPITADFDEEGRLYVADSSGSNDSVSAQLEKKPHRILRLEDTDGDGKFDKSTVFADHMMFPEGTLWHAGSLYVTAPPVIWKLTDTTGDGVADRREEWFDAKTLTGCANDLHGPYSGPDGWIYWCKGAFAEQEHTRPNGTVLKSKAAHIFRRRPDGGGVEEVMTGGMDNPVDVVFTPQGERIFTTTFFQHPGGGQRDGLVHAVYGGVYGKVHNVIDGHPRTGDVMPVLTHLGPAAPCGLTRYESAEFGAEYQNNLFACLFNLHKVTRHTLQSQGASFRTLDEDFLVSDQVDFHPTDVLEDADGSLIVVDTGGWYKICCPTSQLYKPDVLGAIYRVRRTGSHSLEDPRGKNIAWSNVGAEDLAKHLGDPRPRLRQRAMAVLAQQGEASLSAIEQSLRDSRDTLTRQSALWTLMRIDAPRARAIARTALRDADPQVRQVAAYAAGLWRDRAAVDALQACLTQSAPVRRAAAEALGRLGNPESVPPLLQAAAALSEDRVLEHSLIYALIEIAAPEATERGLQSASPHTQRAAMIALDQMEGVNLDPALIAPLLATEEPVLKETAAWLIARHPDWAGELTDFLVKRFDRSGLADVDRQETERQLGTYAEEASVQHALASRVVDKTIDANLRRSALRAMAHSQLEFLPASWAQSIAQVLSGSNPTLSEQAIRTARRWADAKTIDPSLSLALQKVASTDGNSPSTKIQALAAVSGGLPKLDEANFQLLVTHVRPEKAVSIRQDAARVLARASLNRSQLLTLADAIASAGPLEIPVLLSAFDRAKDEDASARLLAALKVASGKKGLRAEVLQPHFEHFPASLQDEAAVFLASLNVDAAQQKSHLEDLMSDLSHGDVRRGQTVFNSERAACSSCHAIGYLGGTIGPDLTRIGQIRTERDLLEAIVYPSASFVRSYEPVIVVTKADEEYSGLLRHDLPDEIILASGPGVETRIARADIAEMRPGQVSVMPGGLDEQLSRQELADLIVFLKATRW